MSKELILIPEVEWDITEAYGWYESRSIELGDDFIVEVKLKLKFIVDDPYLFQIRYDNTRVALLDRFPYAIHFDIIDSQIIVWLICHQRMDFRKRLKKRR